MNLYANAKNIIFEVIYKLCVKTQDIKNVLCEIE